MVTTTSSAANGRQRKTLADQLDRLDTILDGLADALAEAMNLAVKEALTAAAAESDRRPDLHHLGPAPGPTWQDRIRRAVGRVTVRVCEMADQTGRLIRRAWVLATAKSKRQRVAGAVGAARRVLAGAAVQAGTRLAAAMPAKGRRSHRFAAAAGVGLAAIVAGYLGGRLVTAAACGILVMALMMAAAETWQRWTMPCPKDPAPAADMLVMAAVA